MVEGQKNCDQTKSKKQKEVRRSELKAKKGDYLPREDQAASSGCRKAVRREIRSKGTCHIED
jgi:hypothetical protein